MGTVYVPISEMNFSSVIPGRCIAYLHAVHHYPGHSAPLVSMTMSTVSSATSGTPRSDVELGGVDPRSSLFEGRHFKCKDCKLVRMLSFEASGAEKKRRGQ